MKKIFLKKWIWISLTLFFAVLMIAVLIGNTYAEKYPAQINSYFHLNTYEIVNDDNSKTNSVYYHHKFEKEDGTADKDKLLAYDKEIAEEMDEEGGVLLWNNSKALPLKDTSAKINLLGGHSFLYGYTTYGSGCVKMPETPILGDEFTSAGYSLNKTLYDYFRSHAAYTTPSAVNETSFDSIDQSVLDSINGGVGVYVITRIGSEGYDLLRSGSDGKGGNLTALSTDEIKYLDFLKSLKSSGRLDKAVVVLNTCSGALQFDDLSLYKNDIDACIWVGLGGTCGPKAVVDLLSGKAVPSGRLTDTFVYNSFSAPAVQNLGDYDFSGFNAFAGDSRYQELNKAQSGGDSTEKNLKYMVYQEGIYIGYKYYETRYEDCVLNQGKASSAKGAYNDPSAWSYSKEVAYPFGYGLSYAEFAYSDFQAVKTNDIYTAKIKVKNISSEYSGKDVVQIYIQRPYTSYDKDNNIEQSSVNLAGFKKTGLLAPGQEQEIEIEIDPESFLTYDANKAKTYITEEGDYYLSFGTDAHEALNNILAAKGQKGDAQGKADCTSKISLAGNYDTYKSPYTGNAVTNKFDSADINKCGYGLDKITYLSRQDWDATYPSKVEVKMTEDLLEGLTYGKKWEDDDFDVLPKYEQNNSLTLFSLWKDDKGNDIPFSHELWDKLLDETSFSEQTYLLCNAWCYTQEVKSVGAPATENRDGPAGLNYLPDNKVIGFGMCYPSENIMAASFNPDLVWKIGECLGEDNFAFGFTFLYAPGNNIHRTPFSGRNGEYYSEDSFLASKMCTSEVKGLQSNGSGAQIKHFALNDEETNRNGVAIFANEQSIREIYLKAFEKACAKGEGEAYSIMSSFNRIGALWAGACRNLLTDVLRGEWGFIGFVQTDGNQYALMSYTDGLRAGNDLSMRGGGYKCLNDYRSSTTIALAMRESVHRVLYILTKTHAMNGLSSGSHIHSLTPWWRTTIDALIISTIALTSVCGVMSGFSIYFSLRDKKKPAANN